MKNKEFGEEIQNRLVDFFSKGFKVEGYLRKLIQNKVGMICAEMSTLKMKEIHKILIMKSINVSQETIPIKNIEFIQPKLTKKLLKFVVFKECKLSSLFTGRFNFFQLHPVIVSSHFYFLNKYASSKISYSEFHIMGESPNLMDFICPNYRYLIYFQIICLIVLFQPYSWKTLLKKEPKQLKSGLIFFITLSYLTTIILFHILKTV